MSKEADLVLDAIDMGLRIRDYRPGQGRSKTCSPFQCWQSVYVFPFHETPYRLGVPIEFETLYELGDLTSLVA
jgi:hypothetical protein